MSDKESTGSQESGPEKRSNVKVRVFKKHEYDIDLIEVFRSLEELTQTAAKLLKPKFARERYLQTIKGLIESHCRDIGMDAVNIFRQGYLIISPLDGLYEFALALEIIRRDFHKLKAFLAAQQEKYTDAFGFLNLLEFRVYDLLDLHSPLANNSKRQAFLMKWVEEQRKGLQINTEALPKPQDQSATVTEPESGEPAGSLGSKVRKPEQPSRKLTIEEVFFSKEKLDKAVLMLKSKNVITAEGQWNGQTIIQTEILALIETLKLKGYIKHKPKTTIAICFCEYFGVKLQGRTLSGESGKTDPYIPEQTDPPFPEQTDPYIPEQTDPTFLR
jgi:hypothetical protein